MSEPAPTNLEEEIVNESASTGLPWRLLIFSLIIFGFSISVYFGLKFGYAAYLTERTLAVDKKIGDLANQVTQEDQKKFINFYSQLVNLKNTLDRHWFSQNMFYFLEKNTLADVYYTDADFSADRRTLTLKGSTNSLESAVSQLTILEKSADLDNVVLDSVSFEQNKVGLALTISFKEDFFKLPRE